MVSVVYFEITITAITCGHVTTDYVHYPDNHSIMFHIKRIPKGQQFR